MKEIDKTSFVFGAVCTFAAIIFVGEFLRAADRSRPTTIARSDCGAIYGTGTDEFQACYSARVRRHD